MNQWPNGQSGMFPQANPGHLNPASMYSNLGAPNQFDLSQFTQGLQNGNGASSTPAFPPQNFQPGSVVPAKRPHDGMSGSPVQNQPTQGSRSQTPNFGGAFPSQQAGGQQFPNAPTPYAHLQQSNSNNASPSPTLQNQQFRPPPQQQQQRMQNASPSPFPQQQGNFGNQMSPTSSQNPNQPTSMPQQNHMAGFNQQFGTSANSSMSGMPSSMQGQMNMSGMGAANMNAQRAYQMKLMQHQAQLKNNNMIPPRPGGGQQSQMFGAGQQQMVNGQAAGQGNAALNQAQQQQQLKRKQFLSTLQSHAAQQGRQFNPQPHIGGKVVDLFGLWTVVTQLNGSHNVDRIGWQPVANKLGFPQPQFPTAPEELKQLHAQNIAQYERLWFAMRDQHKRDEARQHAQQMAGYGPAQGSPTRPMQPPNQQNQYSQFQQGQQNQMPAQSTPVQANAQLPQNGVVTPQQQMMHHRRASSIRKPDQMTPQAGAQSLTAPSPRSAEKATLQSPPTKQESGRLPMKNDEVRSTEYLPAARDVGTDGGYEIAVCYKLGKEIADSMPTAPIVDEMGIIDVKAITLSLASGIHAEVRYALDALVPISNETRIGLDLRMCEDLFDVIIDCADDQVELLSEEAAEVSDALDLAPYEDIIRACRVEADTLQDVPEFGTQAWDLDRAADKLIAITAILRNLSFWEHNHDMLTSTPLIKCFSNTIRLLGTRNMLLRTFYNTQDFYKDMIVLLSNICQNLKLPSRDDALHILHFLLAFAPQPAPNYAEANGKIRFTSFVPAIHTYLPPAVDCLAKLLARQDPNRMLYRSIFTASSSSLAISESPLDLLTRAFALSISVLPDRSKGGHSNAEKLRLVDARKAYMSQGMLAADILTSLAPSNDTHLARAWIESEDGWAVGLLNLAAVLSVDRPPSNNPKPHQLQFDHEIFKAVAQRALTMMKRLAEKAGRGNLSHSLANGMVNGTVNGHDDEDAETLKWEGIPQGHTILGALMRPDTDKVALGFLCGLHEMAMQT